MNEMEEERKSEMMKGMENKIRNAKALLLSSTGTTSLNLYDHLVNIISKTLEKNTMDVIENFQNVSLESKRAKFTMPPDTVQDKAEILPKTVLAHQHNELFDRPQVEIPDTIEGEEDANDKILPNLTESAYFFEQGGVGLGREETFRIFLALKQLTDTYSLKTCRLWGKIFGIKDNYIIAEVEFKEGEDPNANDESTSPILPDAPNDDDAKDGSPTLEDKDDIIEDDIPVSDYKPPPVIPKEENGMGCNAKVYFVCNEPGLSWSRLPEVTPAQIVVARQIKKLLTGDLEAEVLSYPPFPGNEANYLRAQISRISAATIVSPQGYYMFEEDEEDEDEEGEDSLDEGESRISDSIVGSSLTSEAVSRDLSLNQSKRLGRDHFIMNEEFEGLPISDLIDPSLSGWVHHAQFILPQGRTNWYNPAQKVTEEELEEEEDEDDDKEEPDEPEPETGPPLLTPLSEDNEVNGMAAWRVNKSTNLVAQYGIALIHSNLWPGAHAFAIDRKFENIYIGWGQKYSHVNYSPPPPPATLEEYPSGPDITEAEDPTVEEERALNAARQEALDAADEEEESEDAEDDDDD